MRQFGAEDDIGRMADQKDRLGDKLHDVEAAREDQWARQNDAILLERIRNRSRSLRCPVCGGVSVPLEIIGMQVQKCPKGDGVWLTAAQLSAILER